MNIDLSNLNANTIITLAAAIMFAYLGICVFKVIGRIISIAVGVLLLAYVLQQCGITIPILSDIISYFLKALKPILDSVGNLTAMARSVSI